MELTGYSIFLIFRTEFLEKLDFYANSWLPARKIVEEMIKNRFEVHESGKILKMTKHCPWVDHCNLFL